MSVAGDRDADTSAPIDPSRPSIARMYDSMLGGKDNYQVDRAVRDQLLDVEPGLARLATDNREFLIRVTRFLAGQVGIDQFLDCGSGLPTAENTHEAAQRINREATVVYVDNDPIVHVHSRALLEENDYTAFVAADVTEPERLLAHPTVTKKLDFDRPIALYLIATLHHIADERRPRELMAHYIDALPSGSYVAISHFYNPADGGPLADLATRVESAFLNSALGSGRFRTREEILAYFGDLELVPPGLVAISDWWPDGPRLVEREDVQHLMLGAVARKP